VDARLSEGPLALLGLSVFGARLAVRRRWFFAAATSLGCGAPMTLGETRVHRHPTHGQVSRGCGPRRHASTDTPRGRWVALRCAAPMTVPLPLPALGAALRAGRVDSEEGRA